MLDPTRTSTKRGRSAGTTEAERAMYARSLAAISVAQERVMALLREHDQIALKSGKSVPASYYAQAYGMLLNAVARVQGLRVFLGALRDYCLVPREREVIERVAAALQQKRVGGGRDPEKIKARMRVGIMDVGRAAEIVARKLAEGDACAKNECSVGGCFRVVNTGGFDKKTMDRATDMVAQAAKLVTEAGFAKVCYGDAYVTQKVSRANVLAFYDRGDDRMYVRSNPAEGEAGMEVETIVHELGHRLHNKFLPESVNVRMQEVFDIWTRQYQMSDVTSSYEPKVGDTFEAGGPRSKKRYKVVDVRGKTVSYRLLLPNGEVDPKYLPASFPVSKLSLMLGTGKRTHDSFPSDYARTKPSEMFAELFRAVVHKTATNEQIDAFKKIVGK